MMNGKYKYLLAIPILGITYFQMKSLNKLQMLLKQATIDQCLNRFKEFFDDSTIEIVKKEYYKLIDNGLNPEDAFNILALGANQ